VRVAFIGDSLVLRSMTGLCCAVAVTMLAILPSAAQRAARMALPEGFAARVERMEASGFGGRNEGQYQLGELAGDFTRIESRWALFDPLYAENRGRSSVTLTGPGFDETVAATCEMRRGNVTLGVITFDPSKMTYECAFERAGVALDSSLVLGEPKRETLRERLIARSDRRGQAVHRGVALDIRSVHQYEGTRLSAPTPVGYLLEADGRSVGALELTDVDPTVFVPIAESAEVREAVLVTALALAVLRDPATSALDD
jgi:hypothetical protein